MVDIDPQRAHALLEPELHGAELNTATDIESTIRDTEIVTSA